MTVHAVVGATVADGLSVDVVVDGEEVAAVGPGAADLHAVPPERRVGAAGGLLLPAFVDTHVHLDKVLIRDQLVEHDGTLRGAIDAIHAAKRAYAEDDVPAGSTATTCPPSTTTSTAEPSARRASVRTSTC